MGLSLSSVQQWTNYQLKTVSLFVCLSNHHTVKVYATAEILFRVFLNWPLDEGFFLFNEVPRSRCYGRTAAFRLIVQLCDEDG